MAPRVQQSFHKQSSFQCKPTLDKHCCQRTLGKRTKHEEGRGNERGWKVDQDCNRTREREIEEDGGETETRRTLTIDDHDLFKLISLKTKKK
ncbi:unnamed protein product [Caenorhabditis brenneri]